MCGTLHSFQSESRELLLALLQPTLPFSLPLYRRLQSSISSSLSGIFTSFPLEPVPDSLPLQFTVGLLDLDSPLNQAWVFSSLEIRCGLGHATDSTDFRRGDEPDIARRQLIQMFSAFEKYCSRANLNGSQFSTIVMTGSVRGEITALLRSVPGLFVDHVYGPYGRYIFRMSDVESVSMPTLPTGFFFDEAIRISDHDLILSNNDIITNSAHLLRMAYAVGVRSEKSDTLVAWAFVGLEGCVRTMHVLPEYREQGLATTLAAKATMNGFKAFDGILQEKDPFVYSDVATTNLPSVRVFEKLGGKWYWENFWIKIDLKKAVLLEE